MALSWTIEELLRGVEPIPPGCSSEEMFSQAGSSMWAKAPKRKARGGIPMEAFTDRLMEADRERAAAQAARILGARCKAVDTALNRGLSAVVRELVKRRRLAARRESKTEELRAA